MSIYTILALKIIHEQEIIIGPIAWEEATKVSGFKILDSKTDKVIIEGDGKAALEKLVQQYERLFGRASREVCRSAVKNMVNDSNKDSIPAILF